MVDQRAIRTVIFDIGGTVHPSDHCEKAMLSAFQVSLEMYRRCAWPLIQQLHLGRITEHKFFIQLAKKLHRPVPKNWRSLWRVHFRPYAHIYPSIRRVISALHKQGIKVAALSNTIVPHVEISRQQGVYRVFDFTFFSCSIGLHKPDVRFYRFALHSMGVLAKHTVYIDDKAIYLKPARLLGMRTILARNPRQVAIAVRRIVRG